MLLQIDNVSRTYHGQRGDVRALKDATLSMNDGEFVAVTGPSGCGKTTLLLTAGGLLSPDAGKVLIEGEDPYGLPADLRARLRARKIGFVFQQFHLVPYLTVLENILAPTVAAPVESANERARQLVERFNLSDRQNHPAGELSSGERQRTGLARALMNGPRLLLADEPTGNLDPENAEAVLQSLREFAEEGGGVLLVTHEQHALSFAARVVRMAAGEILPHDC